MLSAPAPPPAERSAAGARPSAVGRRARPTRWPEGEAQQPEGAQRLSFRHIRPDRPPRPTGCRRAARDSAARSGRARPALRSLSGGSWVEWLSASRRRPRRRSAARHNRVSSGRVPRWRARPQESAHADSPTDVMAELPVARPLQTVDEEDHLSGRPVDEADIGRIEPSRGEGRHRHGPVTTVAAPRPSRVGGRRRPPRSRTTLPPWAARSQSRLGDAGR